MNKKLYLDLLKKTLTDFHRINIGEYRPIHRNISTLKYRLLVFLDDMLRSKGYSISTLIRPTEDDRMEGKDWPVYADTMVGIKRLENIELCFNEVISNNIPGDFIETGVWRGGATIFMQALLKIEGIDNRKVWVADSFEGLPKPDEDKYAADVGDTHHQYSELAISLEEVKGNFAKYDLLDDNVHFLKGWFKDTLPKAPIDKLSILRLDGDMYESTMDALIHLYPKLSVGGYIIIDDWGAVPACKKAVNDYRAKHGIQSTIEKIDWAGAYWKKEN